MILTEQPILRSLNTRGSTWGRSEDVRRSIDVLDQVLSEFDDIDSFYNNDNSPPSPDAASDDGQKDSDGSPPPVDRSIKPRSSPPTLPKKTKAKPIKPGAPNESTAKFTKCQSFPRNSTSSQSSTNSQGSLASKHSGASSHEYQEINSVLMGPLRRSSSGQDARPIAQNGQESSQERRRSRDRLSRGSGPEESRNPPKQGYSQSPLRKSKSGEMSFTSQDAFHGPPSRRSGRRSNPRRSRSIDRMLDPRKPPFDPRMQNKGHPRDPRLADPRFFNPRMYDPRFVDPRLVDALLMDPKFDPRFDPNICDPRFDPNLGDPRLYDPRLLNHPFFLDDPRRYPMDDPMNFPHLMTLPAGIPDHFSMPPIDPSSFPHTIPRYNDYPPIHDPLLSPELFMGPIPPPFDPHEFHPHMRGGYDQHMNDFDPALMPPMMMGHPQDYPMSYPMDIPMNYPMDIHPGDFLHREQLNFDSNIGAMRDPRRRGHKHPADVPWMPPSPDEAKRTIQRLVRNQSYNVGDGSRARDNLDYKPAQRSQSHSRRLTSTGHSDSSGTSSPLDESLRHQAEALTSFKNSHGSQCQLPKGLRNAAVHQASRLGAFQVGEAVRKDVEQQKEFTENSTVSLPHFISGGKDSGFEEVPAVEDRSSLICPSAEGVRGATPGGTGGGSFVVAGVFSDSSKMYIPAPPSPTPDYDENNGSDGDESDIPQEPFFVSSSKVQKETKEVNRLSSGSNRDSISDDSLLEGKSNQSSDGRRGSKETSSLQALIEEFHMGLPPPLGAEDGSYSDDSLEEESSLACPSRRSTIRSQRPQSMESLISMEGSTTSFDYHSDLLHSKHPSMPKLNKRLPNEKTSSPEMNLNSGINLRHNKLVNKTSSNNKSPTAQKQQPSNANNAVERKSSFGNSFSAFDCSPSSEQLNESVSSENSSGKFESIKHLIQEGLIEGLDETPPDFKPPPISIRKQGSSATDERADSGMGSSASTNHRADDSGGSDRFSDRSSTTPPKKLSQGSFSECLSHQRSPSPPPLPPPRDSSMNSNSYLGHAAPQPPTSQPSLNRNQSWLYKNNNKRPAPQPNVLQKESALSQCSFKNKNDVEIGGNASGRKPNCITKNKNKEKITHIDDICPVIDRLSNGNLASQYASPQDNHSELLDNTEYNKNKINLEIRKGIRDNLSIISEDQASVSSQGSRSGRFFSRLTDSMKSSSRSNSPLVGGKTPNKNKDKKNNSSRGSTKFHGDIIRDPSKSHNEVIRPLLTPPEFQHSPSSMVPLTRDGSGRFRSIEDLAEAAAAGRNKNELDPRGGDDSNRKRKKHSTLPPNLTPSGMEEQARENSINKDEAEGSKFKLNIFKGFFRRNKYSFDKY